MRRVASEAAEQKAAPKKRRKPRTVAQVARRARTFFAKALHPFVVSIFTPFAKKVPLRGNGLAPAVVKFVEDFEPRAREGLYPHQVELLRQHVGGAGPHFILTSATGSGKSLCFWAWVMDHLLANPNATALLCFPTQALMWSQAARLAAISRSLARQGDVAFGGTLALDDQLVGWTVWKGHGWGETPDVAMQAHARTPSFQNARIRIATLDKAHYSLLRDWDFTRRLACVVLDEAHAYDGMFGANVHYFLKRLYVAREAWGCHRPHLFLASATLGDPVTFGSALLSLPDPSTLVHVADQTRQEIRCVNVDEAIALLRKPPRGGLLRVVFLLDAEKDVPRTEAFIGDSLRMGDRLNAICFVQSRFFGRRLATRLRTARRRGKRQVAVYDGDLPPRDRRALEARFNSGAARGTTLVATNALELGVDIAGLDVCVIDETPPVRQDLLQRIGRVARRDGRPGLVLLTASLRPRDRQLLAHPEEAFRLDGAAALPIPAHVEMVRWRHMLAGHQEGMYRNYGRGNWKKFAAIMQQHFGECLDYDELKARFAHAYGNVVDIADRHFAHKGFRASASQGKIPLVELGGYEHGRPRPKLYGGARHDVAWIDDTSLYRDAHPEGIHLGHDGRRWRIAAYDGPWKIARHSPPDSQYVLAKWLKTITAVYVTPLRDNIVTRGLWDDSYTLYERVVDLPPELVPPAAGKLELGSWDFLRRWRGYYELDLDTGGATLVTLAEVAERFQKAVQNGTPFPFLHPLTYRTFGWRWQFGTPEPGASAELQAVVTGLVERHLDDVLECSAGDLAVQLDLRAGTLSLFDVTPGGNGLAHAALAGGRVTRALDGCLDLVGSLARRGEERFAEYVGQLLDFPVHHTSKEVRDVLRRLRDAWEG